MRTAGGRVATILERRARGWLFVELDGDANDEGGAGERKYTRASRVAHDPVVGAAVDAPVVAVAVAVVVGRRGAAQQKQTACFSRQKRFGSGGSNRRRRRRWQRRWCHGQGQAGAAWHQLKAEL